MLKTEKLKLVSEWDKTFPQSEKVDHKKVTFVNRYGITLAADLYKPKNASGKYPAIAVSGPFGAVKEQCSGLYAQTMAERGYLTIAFDPSFTGESGGYPRFMASPDINTEDFMAAVDFLSVREDVDTDKIKLIQTLGGNRWHVLTKVLLPANVPRLLSLAKVNIGLCLVGVIIGEFISSKCGLGYLIIYASQVFKMDWMLMSIVILCIISMGLYGLIGFAEKWYQKRMG